MEELERNKRIKKEFKRIFNYFEKLDESEKSIIHPLIQNAAFMRVTLEDLQQIIAEQGPVEAYQNGANQHGVKQSAALQSYNALVKNYAAVLKNLFTWLPPADRPKKDPIEMLRSECEEDLEEQKEEKAKKIEEEICEFATIQGHARSGSEGDWQDVSGDC